MKVLVGLAMTALRSPPSKILLMLLGYWPKLLITTRMNLECEAVHHANRSNHI
jgi:hypothetical protein